ncbi:hypothetical protein V8E53_015272 [Lactarius tabidus]
MTNTSKIAGPRGARVPLLAPADSAAPEFGPQLRQLWGGPSSRLRSTKKTSTNLHKYSPNSEGMTWKEIAVMDAQALEAQDGVKALGARRKMPKTLEVVRRKKGIDDPAASPPSSGPAQLSGCPLIAPHISNTQSLDP